MGKNAKLEPPPASDDDERLLEDTVFPLTYCDLEGAPGSNLPDVEADVVAIGEGERKVAAANLRRSEEINRWLEAVTTPGGIYLFASLLAQSKLLQSACLRLTTQFEDFELTLPLLPWVKANLQDWTARIKAGEPDMAPYEVLIKALRTWLSLDKAIGVISGEAEVSLRIARNHLALLDRWIGGTEDLAVSLPEGSNPEDPACPLEAGLPIGSRALGRSAGKAAGYLYLLELEAAAKELEVDFDGTPYYQGSSFELPTLAMYDKSLVGRRPPSPGSLLTFLAASDLALFTPLHPFFADLRQGMRWDSLHPGLRLGRIFEVIRDKELVLDSREAKDYFSFTSTICQALSWPEVPRFLDAGCKIDPDGASSPVTKLFVAACEAREDKPAAFLDPLRATKELPELMPPGTRLADVESSPETDAALELALEAELYALGFQLLYSSEEPALTCPSFKDAVAKVWNPKELLKEYFGIEL